MNGDASEEIVVGFYCTVGYRYYYKSVVCLAVYKTGFNVKKNTKLL